MRLCQALPFII